MFLILKSSLTDRERQIVRQLIKDKVQKEIAYDLNIDERTIGTHAANIYKKYGVKSRVGLVLAVLSENSEIVKELTLGQL